MAQTKPALCFLHFSQPAIIIKPIIHGRKNMFTYEDFKSLAGITDRDELMSAVTQIPEEDLRTALFMTLLVWGRNREINNELWKREYERANKAEAMLNSQPSGK